jgi:hypothetical protein
MVAASCFGSPAEMENGPKSKDGEAGVAVVPQDEAIAGSGEAAGGVSAGAGLAVGAKLNGALAGFHGAPASSAVGADATGAPVKTRP